VSFNLDGVQQSAALIAPNFAYNYLSLDDWSWLSFNVVNGLGFCCFASWALEGIEYTVLAIRRAPQHLQMV
jgi:hypothetical protein